MAWAKRSRQHSYYYHPRRVNGRVTNDYLGNREAAVLAAELVETRKTERAAQRQALRNQRAILEPLDRMLTMLDRGCTLLLAAELYTDGCYRHDRTWRRRRGPRAT